MHSAKTTRATILQANDRGRAPGARVTIPAFRSLLYREPRLYDLIFADADQSTLCLWDQALAFDSPGVSLPWCAVFHLEAGQEERRVGIHL